MACSVQRISELGGRANIQSEVLFDLTLILTLILTQGHKRNIFQRGQSQSIFFSRHEIWFFQVKIVHFGRPPQKKGSLLIFIHVPFPFHFKFSTFALSNFKFSFLSSPFSVSSLPPFSREASKNFPVKMSGGHSSPLLPACYAPVPTLNLILTLIKVVGYSKS